jgi:hypothetical protein
MKRSDLEHIIRAAGAISNEPEIIIIGSQSILGEFPNASPLLLRSAEADIYPRSRPELAELIEGSIGEGSAFHESFGYYAQGVGEDTAVLPADWQRRLVAVNNANTNGYTGLCPEALSKSSPVLLARSSPPGLISMSTEMATITMV